MQTGVKRIYFATVIILIISGCAAGGKISSAKIPAKFIGKFSDDYSIQYTISEKLFLQEPNVKYHILKWDTAGKYMIAKNDDGNPSEAGLYTRIDYMEFENMQPYNWGFCFTEYKAGSFADAEKTAAADRKNPKKGCGGFPFSRLKREGER